METPLPPGRLIPPRRSSPVNIDLSKLSEGNQTGSEHQVVEDLRITLNTLKQDYLLRRQTEPNRSVTEIASGLDLEPFLWEVEQLESMGGFENLKFQSGLRIIGADPIIRFAMLSRIDRHVQEYEVSKTDEDRDALLRDLHLGEVLGLDQSANSPDYELAAQVFTALRKQYPPEIKEEAPGQSVAPAFAGTPPGPVALVAEQTGLSSQETSKDAKTLFAELRQMYKRELGPTEDSAEKWKAEDQLQIELNQVLNLSGDEAYFSLAERRSWMAMRETTYFIGNDLQCYDLLKDPQQIALARQLFAQGPQDLQNAFEEFEEAFTTWVQGGRPYKSFPEARYLTNLEGMIKAHADEIYNQLLRQAEETRGRKFMSWYNRDDGLKEFWQLLAKEEEPLPTDDELKQAFIKKNQAEREGNALLDFEVRASDQFMRDLARKAGLEIVSLDTGDWQFELKRIGTPGSPVAVTLEVAAQKQPKVYNQPWQEIFGEEILLEGTSYVRRVYRSKEHPNLLVRVFGETDRDISDFNRELETLRQLQDLEQVVKLRGIGSPEPEASDSFPPYLVKEFFGGENLREIYENESVPNFPLQAQEAQTETESSRFLYERQRLAAWLVSSMEALAEIHQKGIVVNGFDFEDYLWDYNKKHTVLTRFTRSGRSDEPGSYRGQEKDLFPLLNIFFFKTPLGKEMGMAMLNYNSHPFWQTRYEQNICPDRETQAKLREKAKDPNIPFSLQQIINFAVESFDYDPVKVHSAQEYAQLLRDYFDEVGILKKT